MSARSRWFRWCSHDRPVVLILRDARTPVAALPGMQGMAPGTALAADRGCAVNAPLTLPATVTVTAEHIAAGQPGICYSCPIALALIDAIGNPDITVSVYDDEAVLIQGRRIARANLPGAAMTFIDCFDGIHGAREVEPFTFELTWEAVS